MSLSVSWLPIDSRNGRHSSVFLFLFYDDCTSVFTLSSSPSFASRFGLRRWRVLAASAPVLLCAKQRLRRGTSVGRAPAALFPSFHLLVSSYRWNAKHSAGHMEPLPRRGRRPNISLDKSESSCRTSRRPSLRINQTAHWPVFIRAWP